MVFDSLLWLGVMQAGLLGLVGLVYYSFCFKKNHRDRTILKEIFEGSTSARMITNIQDQAVFYNPAFEDLCKGGEAPHLNVIRHLFTHNNAKDVTERLKSLIQNAQRGHEDVMEAETFAGESGEGKWYRLVAQPVAGWLGYVHWMLTDVTDRRSIETVIREEREKLVDFTDHAPVGFYAMDEKGRFTFVNATLARWLGSDIDTLLNEGFLHAYMDAPPKKSQPYDLTDKGGARQVAELTMKGPFGKTFLASVNQSVVIEDDQKIRVRGVVHDLTSEQEMRQALKESEDRFKRFFEEAPYGIAIIEPGGVILDSNQALAKMLQMPETEIDNQDILSFIAEADKQKVQQALSDVWHKKITSDPVDVELVSDCCDETVAVKLSASPLKGSNIAIRIFDRSEQKFLEAQINQSQKMQAVGQLAGGVAHDFNNLLTAMIGFCDLLLLRHKPGDASFNDIMQIKQNSNRAANLVRQLLAFSRQQKLTPKVLDIMETLTELSHLIRRLIGVQIDLDLFHGKNLYEVKVDEGQFEQVMINLAVNARDAMGGKGRLDIRTENLVLDRAKQVMNDSMPAGEWLGIHVTDTGTGIDKKTLERIFEPFFTTKQVGQGTGLGLATVYGIIRQTEGYIDVDSTVGKGTTFSVYLPRYIEDALSAKTKDDHKTAATEIPEDLTGTATILLVEDEDAVRMFSSRALSNKGYQVLEAASGEAALEVLENHDGRVDIIVTDVIMPEMDGPTMAREVIKTYPDMPILFVSGYTEDRFKDDIGDNAHFLPKPFSLQQLAAEVKKILNG